MRKHTGLDGVEEVGALSVLFDISINQERVGFGVNVFHHDLEAIETSCFGNLYFIAEPFEKIFIDNAIGSSEESKNVTDEESFILVETMLPVVKILGKINFLGSPE